MSYVSHKDAAALELTLARYVVLKGEEQDLHT